MQKLFINIKQLVQVRNENVNYLSGKEMNILPIIENAFLFIEDDVIVDFGKMKDCPQLLNAQIIDTTDKIILPTFIDSHTHIVYAANRIDEFVDRLKGLSYEEIANKGGGILNSAKLLNQTSEEVLYQNAAERLTEVIKQGTGAIEIKSGYGLTLEGEIKMLNVIKRLKQNFSISIKSTFLGAHAFPTEFKENKNEYINLIINQMLPKVIAENLADYIDVFLEKGYFSIDDTDKILTAAKKYDLKSKIHVNQFNAFGGIELCVKHNALSVDHLEVVNEEDINQLKNSNTMPVALPGCSFFIGIPYTPARLLINSGLPLALASDYNPGTSPSGNMVFMIALACIKMKMTPEEAINAATINAAYALELNQTHGSITKGKKANIIVTKPIYSYSELAYSFASNLIESVYVNGNKV